MELRLQARRERVAGLPSQARLQPGDYLVSLQRRQVDELTLAAAKGLIKDARSFLEDPWRGSDGGV